MEGEKEEGWEEDEKDFMGCLSYGNALACCVHLSIRAVLSPLYHSLCLCKSCHSQVILCWSMAFEHGLRLGADAPTSGKGGLFLSSPPSLMHPLLFTGNGEPSKAPAPPQRIQKIGVGRVL